MQLKENELNQIEGGAFKINKPTLALIGGGVAFVIGFVLPHVVVESRQSMREEELNQIYGGAFSAALINAISRGFNTIYELGRSLGTSLKMIISKKKC